ncbi:MAG: lysylphosphatidylglycerol synthase domain-containing protein [Acidilobus sp.]
MAASSLFRRNLPWFISLLILVTLAFYLLAGSLREVLYLLLKNTVLIALASALIAGEELLKSQRYWASAKALGRPLRPSEAVKVHFASLGVGIVTPAFSGSLPTAASMLGDMLNLGPSEALGLALSVTFFDSVVPALASLIVAPFLLPYSLPIVLIAVGVLVAWSALLARGPFEKIAAVIKRASGLQSVRGLVVEELLRVDPYVRLVLSNRRALPLLLTTSLTSYLIEAYSINIVVGPGLLDYLRSLSALMLSYVGGNLPTPGGVMGVEYALALLIPKMAVVTWRASYLLVGLSALALANEVVRHYVGYSTKVRNVLSGANKIVNPSSIPA